MRHTIKTIVAAAAITATSIAVPQDTAFTHPQQSGPDDYALLPAANGYGHSPLLEFQLDRPQVAISYGADAASPSTELLQPVSLGRPEELASVAPVRGRDASEEELTSARGKDLAPAGEESLRPAGNENPLPQRYATITPSDNLDRGSARPLLTPIVRIQFSAPALAPMAHTFFCLKYRDDCKVHNVVFRGGALTLTAKRWAELVRVNAAVNRAIAPHPNTAGLAAEKWLIAPKSGECHDYAVTKRHELLALGWPERDLLLSEVVTSWGEHHLVLVIRTSDGDFVADSLNPNIRNWSKVPYQWVRIQSPGNPTFWSTVASTTVWAKSSRLANPKS